MTQDFLRERHLSGRLVEFTVDSLPEQASLPESIEAPVAKKRAKRTPGGLPAKEQKRNQRARNTWRNEIYSLTADQELVASVVDRSSYVRALEVNRRREERRADDLVEYKIRLCCDNGEGSTWAGTGVYGPRIIAQCFEDSQRRGNGARPRTRQKARLQENRAAFTEVYRFIDDETRELFSRILRADKTSSDEGLTNCPVGAASRVWETEP
jgi:DNA-binding protein H-NS